MRSPRDKHVRLNRRIRDLALVPKPGRRHRHPSSSVARRSDASRVLRRPDGDFVQLVQLVPPRSVIDPLFNNGIVVVVKQANWH